MPIIQGLLSFNDNITEHCLLTPLVSNLEEGIDKVEASGCTHLWEAISIAADKINSFFDKEKYLYAVPRIIVISDGRDVSNKKFKPEDVCFKVRKSGIIVDSILISNSDNEELRAFSHLTGGLSFRPKLYQKVLNYLNVNHF